jgi:hypothetical protein
MAQEKRKEYRLKVRIPISVRVDPKAHFESKTVNLSRLGTYVEIPQDVPAGKSVSVIMALPAYCADASLCGEVKCRGTVFRNTMVREEDGRSIYGLGIFFTDFGTFQDKEKLSRYIGFLVDKEEQDMRDGVRRRKEKTGQDKAGRQGDEKNDFQKEILSVLADMSRRIEEIHRVVTGKSKD